MHGKITVFVVLFLAYANLAHAESPGEIENRIEKKQVELLDNTIKEVVGGDRFAGGSPRFSLSHDEDGGKATLSYSGHFGGTAESSQFEISVTTPFNLDDDTSKSFGDATGISSDTTLTLAVSKRWFTSGLLSLDQMNLRYNVCDQLVKEASYPLYLTIVEDDTTTVARVKIAEPNDAKRKEILPMSGYSELLAKLRNIEQELNRDKPANKRKNVFVPQCSPTSLSPLASLLGYDEVPKKITTMVAEQDLNTTNSRFTKVSLSGEYSNPTFTYVLPTDPTNEIKADEEPWSLELSVGWLRGGWFSGIGYKIKESFKEQKEQQVCTPLAESMTELGCKNVIVGEPQFEESNVVTLFTRKRFGSVGIQLDISRNVDDHETTVHLPIYFSFADFGELDAGIALDWSSEEGTTGSIFVSKPFKLFK